MTQSDNVWIIKQWYILLFIKYQADCESTLSVKMVQKKEEETFGDLDTVWEPVWSKPDNNSILG